MPQQRDLRGALFEREREVAELDDALAAANSGTGQVVVVEGDAGLGKTSLLAELSRRAIDRSAQVLSARGADLERDFPFHVLGSLLRPAVRAVSPEAREQLLAGTVAPVRVLLGLEPDASTPVDPSAPLLDGVFWVVEGLCEHGPLVISVDDGHWADGPSLRALAYVAHRVESLPLVLALSRRPREASADDAALNALCADAGPRRLSLAPLTLEGTTAVARQHGVGETLFSELPALHAVTGGNPLLAAHVAESVAREGAGGLATPRALSATAVGGLLLARLALASWSARRVAEAVAVLGDGSAVAHVAGLAELERTEAAAGAAELERLAIFSEHEPMSFAHPLLGEAVAADAGANASSLAHLRAAHVLRAAGADPALIAGHLMRSSPTGDPVAVQELRAAAGAARARAAPDTAVTLLRRAFVEPPPPDAQQQLQIELGLAEQAAGDSVAAWEHLGFTLDDGSIALEVVSTACVARLLSTTFHDAIDAFAQAADARTVADPDAALALAGTAAYFNWFVPAPLRKPIELPDPSSLTGATPGERIALAAHVARSVAPGAVASNSVGMARASLRDGGLVNDSPLGSDLASGPLLALLYAEDLEAAATELAHIESAGKQHAWPGALVTARFPLIYLLLLRGKVAASVAEAAALLEYRETLSGPLRGALGGFVSALLLLGELAHGGPAAAQAQLVERGLDGRLEPEALFVIPARAHVHLACGRPQQALADAELWRAAAQAIGDPLQAVEFHSIEALALHATGDVDKAREAAQRELSRARQWAAPGRIAGQLRLCARVDPELALEYLEEAGSLVQASELGLERARVLVEHGMVLRRSKARAQARQLLEQGAQAASECQAHALAEVAIAELRVLGARPRRLAFSGADSLTAGERRVAELAASGSTNREIAQRLFVTIKTVDSHLSRTYRKLGISSRTELPDALGARV